MAANGIIPYNKYHVIQGKIVHGRRIAIYYLYSRQLSANSHAIEDIAQRKPLYARKYICMYTVLCTYMRES